MTRRRPVQGAGAALVNLDPVYGLSSVPLLGCTFDGNTVVSNPHCGRAG
jgi:hypothetical protein